MRYRFQRKCGTAWLAMLAMWLTIVVPVVSQAMPAPMPGMGPCGGHAGMLKHAPAADASMPSMSDDPLAQCGYCTLFAHTPGLSGSVIVAAPLPPQRYLPPAPPLVRTARVPPRFGYAPRGPPTRHVS